MIVYCPPPISEEPIICKNKEEREMEKLIEQRFYKKSIWEKIFDKIMMKSENLPVQSIKETLPSVSQKIEKTKHIKQDKGGNK